MKKFTPFLMGIGAIAISLSVVFIQYSAKKEKEEFPNYQSQTLNQNQSTVSGSKISDTTSTTKPTTSVKQNPTSAPSASPSPSSYTMADVAKHNKSSDCWTVINGGVYNVTSWINEHPGGSEAILGLCGIDGSDAFNGQHGGERRPANELASFKIGTLK